MKGRMEKPRIAIYYESRLGRNDGPPLYYFHALKQMGYEINHLLPQGDTFKDMGRYDLHLWVDFGEDALGLPEFTIPNDGGTKVYVASDTHLDDGYRMRKAQDFDIVCFNQKRAYEEYKPSQQNGYVGWMPHAVEPQAYPHIETLKKYDLCFIGHAQDPNILNYNGLNRMWALDRMFREFPNFYYGHRHPAWPGKNLFEDAAHHFAESKIIFNISIKDDVNMRVFEALATGSLLLTNYLPTLPELFEDRTHLVMYKDLDEAVKLAHYYLKHDKEREKIAQAGMELCLKEHTYQERAKVILSLAADYNKNIKSKKE